MRQIIRGHHERFDGTGYPDGLKGDEISLEGRILAVADAYDAMRSNRAYRKALTRAQAVSELKTGTGSTILPASVSEPCFMPWKRDGEFAGKQCSGTRF